MADDHPLAEVDNDDGSTTEDSGSGDDFAPGKRARVQTVRGRPSVVPQDILDAIIKLRIDKEKTFLKSSDGRSKNSSRQLWEEIGKELKVAFAGRTDIADSAFGARQLGKRWSYVEARFKVSGNVLVHAKLTFHHIHSHPTQRYLESLSRSGEGRKQPPSFAQNKQVLAALMEYFHHERPDIVMPCREDSLVGLSEAARLQDDNADNTTPERVRSTALGVDKTTTPPTSEKTTPPLRKRTAMSVIGGMADAKEHRQKAFVAVMKGVTDALQGARTHAGAGSLGTPEGQRSTASLFLSRLEATQEVCEDEEALAVVERAAAVLHGTSQGAAELMASRLCVMSEMGLPVVQCISRLRTFSAKALGSISTSTHAVGTSESAGAGAGAAQ
jgi:hypothetical protein